jgi:hypothetical protein
MKAYAIQMSFTVPNSERRLAEQAEQQFESLIARIKLATEHLDLIYTPFYKHENLDPDEITKYRAVLRNYRDQVQENFTNLLESADQGMILMGNFSTDTDVEEMMRSFDASTKELIGQFETFLTIFNNLSNPDFRNNLLASIDSIKKQANQLKQLINDRILEYIDTNILAKNWMSDLAVKYEGKVKQRMPLVVELYKERQQARK